MNHPSLPTTGRSTLTVSALAARLAQVLDKEIGTVWVRGEIGGLTSARSGHVYFSLKDPQSQLRCVAFQSTVSKLRFKLLEGNEILVRGRPSLYTPRGDLQIVLDWAEPVGAGNLQAEFERLKRKLQAEGLFDPARKRPLPYLPQRVALITSPTGAAIRDVLSILRQRNPAVAVRIVPAPVQGVGAGQELAKALALADRLAGADVLILTRGGGSAEDLSCFNDETLARAIAATKTPVISAVGHEIDFTIADFVADRRAATPSAAAEMVAPVRSELLMGLSSLRGRLDHAAQSYLHRRGLILRDLGNRLQSRSPQRRIADGMLRLDELDERLQRAIRLSLETYKTRARHLRRALLRPGPSAHLQRASTTLQALQLRLVRAAERKLEGLRRALEQSDSALQALNPLAVLDRGFSIARKNGAVLTDTETLARGDRVEVQLARGSFLAKIEQTADGSNKPGEEPWNQPKRSSRSSKH